MKTKILKLSLLLVIILTSSCSSDDDQITGSGNIITQERAIGGFDKIVTPSSVNVDIIYGITQNIVISADDNIIDLVETTVSNSILRIDLMRGNYNDITVLVTVTIPSISLLQNLGSGNISFSNFLDLDSVGFSNSGSGNIEANGSVTNLGLSISGSGSFYGFGFMTQNTTVNNSGSGSSEIYCNNTLNGTLSGSGSVLYKGGATVTINDTGSGSVVNSN